MLAKHIAKDPKIKDSFRALAEYIAAANEKDEKLDHFWMVNCDAGEQLEDLDLGIIEVEATQSLNQRAGPCRSYHLMVSFRPGESPAPAELQAMELAFSKALGFQDHQRICASHINTDQLHFHVAYNRIHPETLKAHTPWNDYLELEKTCRKMERAYGLSIDLGMSDYKELTGRPNNQGRLYESMTWEQSFQSYVLDHREALVAGVAKAKDWAGIHQVLADYNLELKRRGNGVALVNAAPDHHGEAVKASLIDRSLSRGALEKRFGPFEGLDAPSHKKARESYQKRPVTKHPGQRQLWNRYLGVSRGRLKRESVLGEAFRTWREFLYADALNDPLAMAIILTQKRMIQSLIPISRHNGPGSKSQRGPVFPKSLAPVMKAWMEKTSWADPKAAASHFLDSRMTISNMAGLKQNEDGAMLVPLRDIKGTLWAIEAHAPDGRVSVIGQKKPGLVHLVDPKRLLQQKQAGPPPTLLIAEDTATAAVLNQATGQPALATANPFELVKVAKQAGRQWPGVPLSLVVPPSRLDTVRKAVCQAALSSVSVVPLPEPPEDRKLTASELRAACADLLKDRGFKRWHETSTWATPDNAPVLKNWGVRGFGLKVEEDKILIPLKDSSGRIQDVQLIGPDGKAHDPDPDKKDLALHHLIDPGHKINEGLLIVTRGYPGAAALHQATRKPVAMIPEDQDFVAAVDALRRRYKDHKILIAGEVGKEEEDRAATKAGRASLVVPGIPENENLNNKKILRQKEEGESVPINDFHALARAHGFSAVRAQLVEAISDQTFSLWNQATYDKAAPGPGIKAAPAEGSETGGAAWLLPLYDRSGRLAGLQVLDSNLNLLANYGEAQGTCHVIKRKRGDNESGELKIFDDYADALAHHRKTGAAAIVSNASPEEQEKLCAHFKNNPQYLTNSRSRSSKANKVDKGVSFS